MHKLKVGSYQDWFLGEEQSWKPAEATGEREAGSLGI